ncbi:MAG: aldo/keto reductase [Defluviitaleaceae bacterium]|nr:aldo/keto reductase [Defluviitaleaceae bacterium]
MQYRTDPKSGNRLSALGFGCMRFPRNFGQIDAARAEELVRRAVEMGVNYFDTAYIYFGSEEVLGPILERNHLREKIYLATKLPALRCKKYEDFDRFFSEQLRRLRTDYIDYYVMHNLGGPEVWEELRALGIERWIAEKKSAGKIRRLGFSFHGPTAAFGGLLNAYSWDFCQIQYNYVNTHYQAGAAGLKQAHALGLPVMVMEPLLGGKLAGGLPKAAAHLFEKVDPALSPADWALRWLWDQEEVTVVLSGMNELSQLEQNASCAESAPVNCLTAGERGLYAQAVRVFRESFKVPCTGCGYCMPCPHGVNIPGCFEAYNMSYAMSLFTGLMQYWTSVGVFNSNSSQMASQCEKCGRCERQCPQRIPIMRSLEEVKKRMEPFYSRAAVPMIRAWLAPGKKKK